MAPLRISVYDQSLTRVGILFEFVSLTWEETYNDVGALQIVVNKDRTMTSLFKIGYFIGIPDSDELCIITGLEDNAVRRDLQREAFGRKTCPRS